MPLPETWTSIASAFAARVRRGPDAIALFDLDRRMTYAELDARSTGLARGLSRQGIALGDHVGVALDRSIDLVAVMLAVFRIGAVLVPIDPAWPAERRLKVAADARLACTIAIVPGGDRVITLEMLELHGELVEPKVEADAIALALYTSGSTGDPKAVLLGHRALLWRLHALAIAVPFEPNEVACHRTPPTFIDAYAEVFGPLLHGVPTCVLPHPLAIHDLVRALETEQITRLLLVPSVLALVLDACPDLAAHAPALRVVMTSGETLHEALARRCQLAAPGVRLINIYGSTEVAGDATYAEIPSPAPERIPIGRALEGVAVRLVDGEIVVSGPVVAAGYWNRPELTSSRFVRDAATGEMSFRTGDLARWLPDGQLELVGRVDDQVKIGGVRIELGEIERALLAHSSVTAAAAACHEVDGRARLVAGIVCDGDLATVRAHLLDTLPSAAVPSLLARLTTIPTNSHGKIDRRAVCAAVVAAATSAVAPPDDELVARSAAWFTEVTGQPANATDELEAVGGDSLARLGLLIRLERDGFHLEHSDLPRPLTPHRLADRLREIGQRRAGEATPAEDHPLTDFQRVMVLESLANRGTAMWVDQLAYTFTGPLDFERFVVAWRETIAAEPALRTSIVFHGDDLRQVAKPDVPLVLARLELRELDQEAYRLRVLAEEWTRLSITFALDRAPLFELCLLEGPGSRADLIFTYHHAILDGESARRVLRAVLARSAGRFAARGSTFVARTRAAPMQRWREMFSGYVHPPEIEPPRATGFGDFVWRMFHRLIAFRARAAVARVRRRTKRAKLRGLLAAASLTPSVYAGGDIASQPLSTALARSLRAWARSHRTTPAAIWAAAFALHLARERNTRDVVFGVIVSGRDGRSAETIGMLANCLPLRVRADPAASIEAFVGSVGHGLDVLEQLAHTPLLALQAEIGLDPRAFLDTQFVSWGFPVAADWQPPDGVEIRGGRGVTLTAPRTALIVSGDNEVAVGARAFHRTDRIRREILAIVDLMLDAPSDTPLARLLGAASHEGGMSVGLPDL